MVGPSREHLRALLRACEALRNRVRQLVDANDRLMGPSAVSQIVTDAYRQLGATANWNLTEHIFVFVAAVNITDEIIYQRTADGIPIGFYENGPRSGIGARLRF